MSKIALVQQAPVILNKTETVNKIVKVQFIILWW